MFAFQYEEAKPDILTVGKAIGAGVIPLSAAISSREIMSVFTPGSHGSTFGGNPLACAVGEAAIDVLVSSGEDTWLVLGDMGELGDEKEALHRQVGAQAGDSGVRHLLATGDLARFAAEAFGKGAQFFEDREQLIDELRQGLEASSVVLVKGSRSMSMEQIVNALVDDKHVQGAH
jgi:adenosylmethionine-8-amino-7-oxononanoate aminotransferase